MPKKTRSSVSQYSKARERALHPFHYLVRIYGSDKKTMLGVLVLRISPKTATDQVEVASPNLYRYLGASRRRPMFDLTQGGYGWREFGRKRALTQAKRQAIKDGRGWLFKEEQVLPRHRAL